MHDQSSVISQVICPWWSTVVAVEQKTLEECAANRRFEPARLHQGREWEGGLWEAKHGEITSLPVSCSCKKKNCTAPPPQCWTRNTVLFQIFGRRWGKATLNLRESRAPADECVTVAGENTARLPACVFAPEGWQCWGATDLTTRENGWRRKVSRGGDSLVWLA